MSGIKWYVKGTKIVNEEKVRKYWKTSLNKILDVWKPNKQMKFCKIEFSEYEYVEFIIYNSEPFTSYAPSYQGCMILDRFQVMVTKNTIVSNTFTEQFDKTLKKFPRRKVNIKHWYEKEVIREELNKLYELLDNLDAYKVMDRLMGDDESTCSFCTA